MYVVPSEMEEFKDNLLNHVDPVQRRHLRIMYHITCKLKCPLRGGGGWEGVKPFPRIIQIS